MDKCNYLNMVDTAMRVAIPDCPCGCVTAALPENPAVTMAYVPFQLDKTSYSVEKALCEGTLFTSLNKPFYGRSVMNG